MRRQVTCRSHLPAQRSQGSAKRCWAAPRYAVVDQNKKTPSAIATADHPRMKVEDCPDHQEISFVSLSAPMNGSAIPEMSEITPKTSRTAGVCEEGAELHKATPKTIRLTAPIQTPSCPCHFRTNETSPAGLAIPYEPMKTMIIEKTTTRKAMMSPLRSRGAPTRRRDPAQGHRASLPCHSRAAASLCREQRTNSLVRPRCDRRKTIGTGPHGRKRRQPAPRGDGPFRCVFRRPNRALSFRSDARATWVASVACRRDGT